MEGSVAAGGTADYPFQVTTGGRSLGVSMRTTNGHSTCVLPVNGACWYGYEWDPDIDISLVDPSGTVVAMSRCMLESSNDNCAAPGRFETLGIDSAAPARGSSASSPSPGPARSRPTCSAPSVPHPRRPRHPTRPPPRRD